MSESRESPPPHEDPFDPTGLPPEARFSEADPVATGKDLHIPGAGTLGLVLLLASLSVLFIASMAAYVIIRLHTENWARSMPHVPRTLWLSTIVIVASSVTIQLAFNAVRRDDERRTARWLIATFVLGILFLILQTLNWIEFYVAIRNIVMNGAYLGMFFVLTGLHAAHVLGGLIPLAIVIVRAKKGRYSRNFHPGVRYVSAYWHFLDIVWLILFSLIYFQPGAS